jgi:lipopolysaccharide transport system ATP-binding protein
MSRIIVDDVSKEYRLGETQHGAMLRQAIVNAIRRPFGKKAIETETIWALRDVSLSVEDNEVVGLIGRNGAGKTTLLKVLSRITYPTSGSITVRGRVASLVEVGTGFHQELTGRENIYLNGSILGLRKREIDERFDKIVEFSGVSEFIDTPVKRFSTGMRLRLGFAVAAHLSPDVLLVDEVLSVGDYDFQQKCLRALDEVRDASRTVVFVSHNLEAVEQLCPRSVWIDHGKVRMDGPSREVIGAYLSSVADSSASSHRFDDDVNRTGSGEVRFRGLEFLRENRQPADSVRSGDRLVVRLHYDVNAEIRSPYFGVRLYTDLGTLVADVNTWQTGYEIPVLSVGEGYLDLDIEKLNLMPGSYFVSLWSQRLGEYTVFDLLEHCAVLDVSPSNYYGSGRGLDRRYGLVFFPCSWTSSHD